MYLSNLQLENFRSYKSLDLDFKPQKGLNIFLAPNGEGKTNLLEAISLLSFPKSFRNLKFNDITHFDSYYFCIQAQFANFSPNQNFDEVFFDQSKTSDLKVVFDKKQKQKAFFQNQIKLKSKDFMGNFHTIVFTPEDLHLFVLGPTARRRLLNTFLSTLFKDYFTNLLAYNQNLKVRNKLLKDGSSNPIMFKIINQSLSKHGAVIYHYRKEFLDYLNQHLQSKYLDLAPNSPRLTIQVASLGFQPSSELKYQEEFLEHLDKNFQRDCRYRSTCSGIHRDDFSILYDAKPIQDFYSRGENRTFILALKLLQVEYLEQFVTFKPILLLDDVFSELDKSRRHKLLEFASQYQTFITTVEKAYFKDFQSEYSSYRINDSQVSKI